MPTNIPDETYAQKEAEKFTLPGGRHPNDVRALVQTPDGQVWVGTGDGLYIWRDTYFERLPNEWIGGSDIKALSLDDQGRLWVAAGLSVAVRESQNDDWTILLSDSWDNELGLITAIAACGENVIANTTEGGPILLSDGKVTQFNGLYPPDHRIFRLSFDSNQNLWALGEAGAVCIDLEAGEQIAHLAPELQVRAMAHHATGSFLATSEGLFLCEGDEIEEEPLVIPMRDLHDIAINTDGTLWVASSRGVYHGSDERESYFNGQRWLPHNDVRTLLCIDEHTTLVGTAAGCAKLHRRPSTLADKATAFEQRIRDRHIRLTGFVNNSRLSKPGDLATSTPRPSDNDGLWTALYLAAQSYRYAVTQDEEAQQFAQQAFHAMEWLENVTSVPGYPTKAIVSVDEDMSGSSIPWYPSTDGKWLWKGDCSSDEIDGHMYGYTIYYDLAATSEEQERIQTLVRKIIDHILDHGYFIVGPDGERTRWGVWAPSYLNGPWRAQRGLNSLEILAHLRTAHHITNEQRYEDAYFDLINNHGYAENMRRQKLNLPGHINHSDDELAFISYYPLLKYETDPNLREIYLDSLEHAWQIERPERNPWWNYIYGALTENPCDEEMAIRTLREIPMDLINWPVENSHRLDIAFDSDRGRFGELQSVEVLPYDELAISKWNGNPYRVDSPTNGTDEDDGTYYLLPYWMGRYYGFIS